MNDITQEQFDNELMKILSEYNGRQLLLIPGIYEIVSEHFNNDVLNNLNWEVTQQQIIDDE